MIAEPEIEPVTFRFTPRWYQRDLFKAMNPRTGPAKLHGCLIWPRRKGKDLTGLNFTVLKALKRRGAYYYFFPTYRLGKRVIWDGMDDQGIPYRDYIPGEIVEDENETELQITLTNGSMIYIMGADKIDRAARGTNVVGVVYSEFRDISPIVRRTIAPILGNNNGWELIITTPRGHNHLYDLTQLIASDPVLNAEWYYSKHTVETCAVDANDLAKSLAHIDLLRREGVPEEWIQQEYYTSFEGFQEGSFFGDALNRAYKEERICELPYLTHLPVNTACDLGTGMSFVTWYWQECRDWIHFIDYEELSEGGIPEFRKQLDQKPYIYGYHFAPHDAINTDVGSGLTRMETAQDLGIDWLKLPKIKRVGDRINAARIMFPRTKIDTGRCEVGLSRLLNYRREYDEFHEVYKEKEVRDKNSHGGAAFCYAAMGVSDVGQQLRHYGVAEMDFDEFGYDHLVKTAIDDYE